jgi:gas vesicle protein
MKRKRIFLLKVIFLTIVLQNNFSFGFFGGGDNAVFNNTLGGAAIGGIAGGRRGAGIGAAVGFGTGLIAQSAQSKRDNNYYRPRKERNSYKNLRECKRDNRKLVQENDELYERIEELEYQVQELTEEIEYLEEQITNTQQR